ncbi:MAG TPA: ABC transporter substrate-binding protein [Methylomirabilota bacterium]
MDRRTVLAALVGMLAWPRVSRAKEHRSWRIGWLSPASAASGGYELEALRGALRALGYLEGQSIVIDARWADGKSQRLPDLARALVGARVDVICTSGTPATMAAKAATGNIPIIFGRAAFPDKTGLVSNLSRPGGNLTGVTFIGPEYGKRLEMLREVSPRTARVALLYNDQNAASVLAMRETQEWGRSLQTSVEPLGVHDEASLQAALSAVRSIKADALMTTADPLLASYRSRVVDFANEYRLIAMYGEREYVRAGGLMFYGTSTTDMWRHAATHVDRVLKGAKPGDLPVEQPTQFELMINLKTAKALGLTLPQSLLLRADQLIE